MSADAPATPFGGRTAWARNLAAPVRSFLSIETGGAGVLLAAAAIALLWSNLPGWHSYEQVWTTHLAIRVGSHGVTANLRQWVNQGLMTFFFLVIGLEAKRELDLGELRERSRLAVPVVAGLAGVAVPIVLYLLINAGGSGAHGWGTAMSTDTAFALGVVALITPRTATRLRVFLLTLAIVDDLAGLVVITVAYTGHVRWVALAIALGLFVVLLALRYAPVARAQLSVVVAVAIWVAMFKSGIDPVVCGLAIGLGTSAYPPSREDLERASALAREFREQPTPELARSAQRGVLGAISMNERLQYDLHPWTRYVIVPLFALANAGIHLTGTVLSDAFRSTITLGILVGYLVGKPVGIFAGSWLASRPRLHGPRSPISGPVIAVGGASAAIGFTVSLLIAALAFHGTRLEDAKIGTLCSVVLGPAMAWLAMNVLRRVPQRVRARQIEGTAEDILDLAEDVDPERDHIRGTEDAPVTLVEYGDFECEYCGQAEQTIRELLSSLGTDVRYVWRHLPLNDVHPSAQVASEASEAAAAQGRFWDMYDTLLSHQGALSMRDLIGYARDLGLDVERFVDELRRREYASRIAEDVASADESGVSGTPSFFINGRRHYGVYDIDALTAAVKAAKNRAGLRALARPEPEPEEAPTPS
jgi:Na+/H+ antiporter NhaA